MNLNFVRMVVVLTSAFLAPSAFADQPNFSSEIRFNQPHELRTNRKLMDSILKSISKETEILGLGENAHGSQEPHLLRVELIKTLVEKKGFRVLSIEAPAYLVDLIQREGMDPNLNPGCKYASSWTKNTGFEVWHSKSLTEDLFSWICRWNRRKPNDPVILTGFDVQMFKGFDPGYASGTNEKPSESMKRVSLFRRVIEIFQKQLSPDLLRDFDKFCEDEKTLIPQNRDYRAVADGLERVSRCSRSFFDLIEKIGGQNSPLLSRQDTFDLESFRFSLEFLGGDWGAANPESTLEQQISSRDAGMMSVAFTQLRTLYPGKKMILYGHNSHLGLYRFKRPNHPAQYSVSSVGHFLMMEGIHYQVIGLIGYQTFSKGRFQRLSADHREGFLENELKQSGFRYAFLPPNSKRMQAPTLLNDLNDRYNGVDKTRYITVPRDIYSALIFYSQSDTMIEPEP